jgi:hypothetical protein
MPHYEVTLFSEELIVRGPPARLLAFHATLILDAPDEPSAQSAARDALLTDLQLTAIAAEPPTVELDGLKALPETATPHGPILCFFQLPPAAASPPVNGE